MNHLLIFADDDSPFSVEEVRSALEAIGCRDIREGMFIESVLDCEFDFSDQSIIIRLADDFKTLSMSNTGDAALKAAFDIQEQIARPLRAVDMSYSFDVSLKNLSSFEELLQLTGSDGN
jgi:hypothetical protein